jgi:hypothetical protein
MGTSRHDTVPRGLWDKSKTGEQSHLLLLCSKTIARTYDTGLFGLSAKSVTGEPLKRSAVD